MRQKKRSSVNFQRVESVEIIKRTDKERIEEVCPDGKVYDLEIEDNHNYFANGFLAHNCSAFPKPGKRTKAIKRRFKQIPCIWLSGTPCAESSSQWFHQFWVSDYTPFEETNFYRWANSYVNKKIKYLGTHKITDYSDAKSDLIESVIEPYIVSMTQEDAGFEVSIDEIIINIPTPKKISKLAIRLINNRAIEGEKYFLMGDSPAKLQSKVHQIFNGSVIVESADGNTTETIILSDFKAKYIKENFKGKLAIMHYFKAELDILKSVFGDNITTDLNEFNSTDKHIALQQSSVEGMNLSKADSLIFYNFGFSGKNYIQSRDRLTIKGRKDNKVYFLIEKGGINGKILNKVRNKQDYNLRAFKADFGL